MPEELMAQTGTLGSTFYQPRNIGNDKALLRTDANDTKVRMQGCKRIVGYFWPGIRDRSNQSRLACVGQAKQSNISKYAQFHIHFSSLPRLTIRKLPWGAIDAGFEMEITEAAAAAPRE